MDVSNSTPVDSAIEGTARRSRASANSMSFLCEGLEIPPPGESEEGYS
jgi:hypothetical protein